MSKNKLIPELRFPEFKNEGEWEYVYGDELFESISNKDHNSDLPILAITQEQGAVPRNMINYHVSVTEKSIESYKVVEIGDFIISLRSFQGGIEYSNFKGLCSPAYIILRKKVDLENDYYRHYFKSVPFIRDLNRNIEGIRDGKMVSYQQFSEILLPKPTKEEQHKIAVCFSSLDKVVEANREKLELLKDHKKGLMQNLFPQEGEKVPKIRFKEFEKDGMWLKGQVGDLIKTLMGYAFKSEDFVENGIQLIRMGNLYQGDLKLERTPVFLPIRYREEYSNFLVKPGDILMSMTGTIGKRDYGFVIQTPKNCPDLLLNQRVLKIIPRKNCVKEFILQLMKDDFFLEKLYFLAGGTKQANLSVNHLNSIEVSFPSVNEQLKIASFLSSLDEIIKAQTEVIEQLKLHKKGLMQRLLPETID